MASEFTLYLSTQVGNLMLEVRQDKLLSLSINDKSPLESQVTVSNQDNANEVTKNILQQLKNYFSSAISLQTISLAAQGTLFEKAVWHELSKIPLGETRTYGEIAKNLNSSARAVGNACRKNPIQIIVPCHRVIAANGLGGYAGETEGRQLSIKRWLLNHEGVQL